MKISPPDTVLYSPLPPHPVDPDVDLECGTEARLLRTYPIATKTRMFSALEWQ